jgi:hypothetical protein
MLLIALLAVGCSVIPICEPKAPTSSWGIPSCADFNFDDALFESTTKGDRSAVQLLEKRYATTFTRSEHIRIGGFLLGRVRDDGAIWNELQRDAENLIDFDGHPEKLAAFCARHGYEKKAYVDSAWAALNAISPDRRSRPLLLRALQSRDRELADRGIIGLWEQHDEGSFAEIEDVVKRFPDLAFRFAFFKSDTADRIAEKYLRKTRSASNTTASDPRRNPVHLPSIIAFDATRRRPDASRHDCRRRAAR